MVTGYRTRHGNMLQRSDLVNYYRVGYGKMVQSRTRQHVTELDIVTHYKDGHGNTYHSQSVTQNRVGHG